MLRHSYTRGLLFHYTTKERAIENILHGMTIRMGPTKATNDPRETDPWFFGMTVKDEENAPSGEEFLKINQKIDRILKSSCLISCFTEDAPDPFPELDPDLYHRKDLGPQGYEHDRMWAQYAGNHTGVCIFFDRDRLVRRMEEHFRGRAGRLLYGPVDYYSEVDSRESPFYELSYDEMRHVGVETYARRHQEAFARQLYLTKNPDWANEQEYRFVWIDEDEDEGNEAEYVPIEGCISALCLGAHFPEVYEVNVRTIKQHLSVAVHRVYYSYGKLGIASAMDDPVVRSVAPPTLKPDPAFGVRGTATTAIGDASDAHCVVLQPDNKVVVAGGTATRRSNGTLRNEGFALARYTADGELDATFGDGGIVVTAGVGAFQGGAHALALQPDGKIVAGGTSRKERTGLFALARYEPDGSLDRRFGEGGKAELTIGDNAELHDLALQPDGKIVVAGTSRNERDFSTGRVYRFTVVRLLENGGLDLSFGHDGVTVAQFFGGNDAARVLSVQPDGNIVTAGYCEANGEYGFALARYGQDGSPDVSFGDGGRVITLWGAMGGQNWANDIVLQTNGKLVVAGQVWNDNGYAFALARYNSDGSLDGTFGQGGKVMTPVGRTRMAYANALSVQPDDRITCAGYADGHFAFARYDSAGNLDPSFGNGGTGTTNFGAQNGVQALLPLPNGKLLAVGASETGSGTAFALARY